MLTYAFKTGFKNLGARKLFTFASIITIACSILVFCIFFVLATNLQGLINKVESSVAIEVFFNEGLTEEEIQNIANNNFVTTDVKSIKFKSSNEAWENFKKDYFDDREELAAAFEDDNPLANSASYEILLKDISRQYDYVAYLKTIDGVRQVNYSNILIEALTNIKFWISSFSLVLIILLLLIGVILISNTISVTSQFRKKENEIMKLIGATNFMIRAPFIVEGLFIGLFGSIFPVALVCGLYNYLMNLIIKNASFLSNIFEPMRLVDVAIPMALISIVLSCLVSMIVSAITIRKHLKI